MPEDKRNRCAGAQVSKPVPREEACDTEDELLPVRRDGLEERVWASWHMPVPQDRAVPVHATEVHGAGMQITATVKWVLLRGEAPEVSSALLSDSCPLSAYHGGLLERVLNKYQGCAADCLQPTRCSGFR